LHRKSHSSKVYIFSVDSWKASWAHILFSKCDIDRKGLQETLENIDVDDDINRKIDHILDNIDDLIVDDDHIDGVLNDRGNFL
jgi:hypothetical protein